LRAGPAIADHPADGRAQIVPADRDLISAQIEIARTGERAHAEVVVVIGSGAARKIDNRASASIGDGGEATRAVATELQQSAVVDGSGAAVGTIGKSRRAAVVDC
jgi:hypothetical protein